MSYTNTSRPRPPRVPIVSLSRVSRFYSSDKAAVFDVSIDIYPSEFIYIAGPSGVGKSTLLRLIHVEESPDTGTILFGGHDLNTLKKSAIAVLRRSIGPIFQDFLLVPDMTVTANVCLPLEVAGFSRADMRERSAHFLELVGLAGRGREIAGGLSGGEQQRVAIARALVNNPELILADEPTGSLDAYNADFVLNLLEKTCLTGTTVILATHDRMLMAARPHRTLSLNQGRVIGLSESEIEAALAANENTSTGNLKQVS